MVNINEKIARLTGSLEERALILLEECVTPIIEKDIKENDSTITYVGIKYTNVRFVGNVLLSDAEIWLGTDNEFDEEMGAFCCDIHLVDVVVKQGCKVFVNGYAI